MPEGVGRGGGVGVLGLLGASGGGARSKGRHQGRDQGRE